MSFQRFLVGKAKHLGSNGIYWAFPLTVGFTWLIWDALDEEWLVSLKLATDPESLNKRIETERLARLEALKKPKPTILKSPVAKEAPVEIEDDEPEEDEVPEDSPSEDVEEEAPADEDSEDVPAGEDGDDAAEEGEEEEEEEEEESEVVIKPLYDPIKGKKLGKKDIWDNFTIKALNMGEDDDDDDEEEEEEEEEE